MPKCYTFYSYKGGSGRSTTAVNTVRHLIDVLSADKERPILIVDADLESAGLTYFFGCENCFTNMFSETIHTTKVFTETSSTLDEAKRDLVFSGKGSLWKISEDSFFVDDIERCFKYYSNRIKDLFRDVELLDQEIVILKKIVSVCSQNSVAEENEKIYTAYNAGLAKLISNLDKTENNNEISQAEKKKIKTDFIRKFLPAVSFADVSSHFAAEEGTVKFLGVDVRFNGEQIMRSQNTTAAIRKLIRIAEKNNYSAVIFDSGAGTQSSADAFHQVSDVLVYCMRPTKQFRAGTDMQLANRQAFLRDVSKDRINKGMCPDNYKPVILFPAAVPTGCDDIEIFDRNADMTEGLTDDIAKLRYDSMKAIVNLASKYKDVVDDTFCSFQTALNEVELFKWDERILISKEKQCDSADLKRAFDTYKMLAQKLAELSGKA